MGELQAQVARQSQELAFYRGVVAQGAVGTRGQDRAAAHHGRCRAPAASSCTCRWCARGAPDSDVGGTLHPQPRRHRRRARPSRWILPRSPAARSRELRFNFRYLQTLDQEMHLPPAFKPEQLQVEVRSSKKDVAPVSQSFLWTVDAAP